MLTRRHIRIKVMQSVYALQKDPSQTLDALTKNYSLQLQATYDLYFVMYGLLCAIYQKHKERHQIKVQQTHRVASDIEKSTNLINNRILQFLVQHPLLAIQLQRRKIKQWELHFEYVDQLVKELENRGFYKRYMEAAAHDWQSDLTFVLNLYRDVIAPHDAIFDFLEDQHLGWNDDFSLVNTYITKQLKKIRAADHSSLPFPALKDQQEDHAFGSALLEMAVAKREILEKEIEGKTPNWESDRIAQLDLVLLQLGVAELLFFESIPPKVTLNEYLEIAKDYSTPKSNVFINGVLDKLAKEFSDANRMKKKGRGLKE